MPTKSPLPTSLTILLATLFAIGAILVVVNSLPGLGLALGAYGVAGLFLALLGLPFFVLLGVIAGLRYRADRTVLNRIGLWGSLFLFLGILTMIGRALWQTRQERQLIQPALHPVESGR